MTDKTSKRVIRLWKKIEDDLTKLKNAIVDLESELYETSDNITDSKGLKYAVLVALKEMFEYHEAQESEGTRIISLWVSAGEIRDMMLSKGLFDTEALASRKMYSEIGLILAQCGFSARKRCSSGMLRLIERDKLEKLLEKTTS